MAWSGILGSSGKEELGMAIAWACRLSVAEYAAAGRKVDVPRPDCPNCGRPMTFEGSYPRWVRRFPTT